MFNCWLSIFFFFIYPDFHFIYTKRALFGYEGQSNALKVVSSGDGGLIEISEDLNSGKIMYAFVGVDDPKTTLTKYILINWQVSKSSSYE